MTVRAIPEGFHRITAQLTIDGAAEAIAFYKAAFGAEEISRALDPSGQKIWHAELKLGDSRFFVNDSFPDMGGLGPSKSAFFLYVEDADALYAQAVAAGGAVKVPIADMFWGDRVGSVIDPFGQVWSISQHVRDVSPEEMAKITASFGKK